MTDPVHKHKAAYRASYDERSNPYLLMTSNRQHSAKRSLVVDLPLQMPTDRIIYNPYQTEGSLHEDAGFDEYLTNNY